MKKSNFFTLITGASEGIGLALAREFASRGHNLILVARNAKKLEDVSKEIALKYRVSAEYIAADLTVKDELEGMIKKIQAKRRKVDILINNAGFGLGGSFESLDIERQLEMIDLNIKALVRLTHHFIPKFHSNENGGKIINIASVAGYFPGPYMNVYYATKAFVVSFSEALSKELEGSNVQVTCVCPGATETNFDKVAGISNSPIFNSVKPASAQSVATATYLAVSNDRSRIVPGWSNKLSVFFSPFVPQSIKLKIIKYIQTGKF